MLYMHKRNLIRKINENYKGKGDLLNKFYQEEYNDYYEKISSLDYASKDINIFKEAVNLIEEYLEKIDELSRQIGVKSQSKFRSTVIEEISTYLFQNHHLITSGTFGIFNKNIFSGMKIDNHMHIDIIPKDVDFCIGKKVKVVIDDEQTKELIIPVVCVEVKTYLDATMFGEVQYSSKQIKNASPNAKTYVLMEYNSVAKEKIIAARYDNVLNEMFVLRADARSPLSEKVLLDYYIEIENALKNTENVDDVVVPGKLINPS